MSRISPAPASLACTKQAGVLRFEAVHCDSRMLYTNKTKRRRKRYNSPSKAGYQSVLWNPHWVSSFWRTETSWGKLDFVCLVNTPQHPQKPLDVRVTLDWLTVVLTFPKKQKHSRTVWTKSRTSRNTQINTCYNTNYSPSIFIVTFTFPFWLDFDG